jgi:hypothetical protein
MRHTPICEPVQGVAPAARVLPPHHHSVPHMDPRGKYLPFEVARSGVLGRHSRFTAHDVRRKLSEKTTHGWPPEAIPVVVADAIRANV